MTELEAFAVIVAALGAIAGALALGRGRELEKRVEELEDYIAHQAVAEIRRRRGGP